MGERFWEHTPLADLSRQEWELLCDGCARCCLLKMEDEESGQLYYTRIACQYLDLETCRCSVYQERTIRVPTCHRLTADNLDQVYFMPRTCAYRLLAEGKPLPWWHPLVAGDRAQMQQAGIALQGRVLSERYVHPDGWDEHVIDWVD